MPLSKVRSPDTLGIAGMLKEDAEVFYTTLFDTQNIGKISDLLSARLQKSGVDEFRLRFSVLLSVFEATQGLVSREPRNPQSPQSPQSPMTLECGIDGEKIAIGVSASLHKDTVINTDGLVTRVSEGQTQQPFERFLVELNRRADQIFLKLEQQSRKFEVIALIGLSRAEQLPLDKGQVRFELIFLDKDSATKAPKPRVYVNLGDLDYSALLKEDVRVKPSQSPGGEITRVSGGGKEKESETLVKGKRADAEEETRVKGAKDGEDELTQVKGKKEKEDDLTRVKGGAEEDDEESLVKGRREDMDDLSRVKGKHQDEDESLTAIHGDQSKEGDGVVRVKGGGPDKASKGSMELKTSGESEEEPSIWQNTKRAFRGLFDKMRGGRKQASDNDDEESLELESGEQEETKKKAKKPTRSKEKEDSNSDEESAGLEADMRKLLSEIEEGGIDQVLKTAEEEAESIKKELKSPKANQWVDHLMSNLVKERSRLNDLARKLQGSARAKEMENREKLAALRAEVREKDAAIAQKTVALARTKEQMVKLGLQAEMAKNLDESNSEELYYKKKYENTNKQLELSKHEHAQLVQRIEELKSQVAHSHSAARSQGPSHTQFSALEVKNLTLARQNEDFKRINRQLMEKLDEAKKARPAPVADTGGGEFKRRLEMSMKLIAQERQEKEILNQRYLTSQKDHMRLREELKRVSLEKKQLLLTVQMLQKNKKPEGGSGTPPHAA